MENARFMKEEMDGEVFVSTRVGIFSFLDNMLKALFSICTLNWRVVGYVSRQRKGVNTRNESTNIKVYLCSIWYCTHSLKLLAVCFR